MALVNDVTCRQCDSSHPVLANEWFGEQGYVCPPCEHVWDAAKDAIEDDRSGEVTSPDPAGPEQLTFSF